MLTYIPFYMFNGSWPKIVYSRLGTGEPQRMLASRIRLSPGNAGRLVPQPSPWDQVHQLDL